MAGKEGKSIGKVGRPSVEDKQRKLTLEDKEGKRVMFRLSEESIEKEEKKRITEVCKDIIGIELRALEE